VTNDAAHPLHDEAAAVRFYEDRYSGHYMEEWSADVKARIIGLIRELDLPAAGEALDFGCGQGVMTGVLRQALGPGWKIYGSDISSVAVANARQRFPDCTFFTADDPAFAGKRFDFLFTHHVLEHVAVLSDIAAAIDVRLKPRAAMLHILPCGNEGSLEHQVARLRRDGIDPKLGNRFFFEDVGHLRRLRSNELEALFRPHGFRLTSAAFRNQYHGALDWMTQSPPGVVRTLVDLSAARGPAERAQLRPLRRRLLFWWMLRYPSVFLISRLLRKRKTLRDYVFGLAALPLFPVSKLADRYISRLAAREWETRRGEPCGSEMFLFLQR
jgi:SAM-dependent methyltransferase